MTKAFTPPPLPPGSKLKVRWLDEFTGTALDTTKWKYHIGDGSDFGDKNNGWYNLEKQCYVSEAATIDPVAKCLVLTATASAEGCKNARDGKVNATSEFRSAKIVSTEAFGWTGTTPVLISVRVKVPMAERSFPAVWLLPSDPNEPWQSGKGAYGPWCTSGEIDIMEHLNKENKTYATVHFRVKDKSKPPPEAKLMSETDPQNTCARQSRSYGDFAAGNGPDSWHIYSVLWDPNYIKIFVDDKLVLDLKTGDWELGTGTGSPSAPFDKPFNLIINHAVGGTWVDTTSDKIKAPADYPASVMVDYVVVHDVER
jgi:beta-glucanase (GH16 family)